mgnify:CR=1 FL=1
MKERKKTVILWVLLSLLLLGLVLVKPAYYLYREMDYRMGEPTAGEQTVHDHARQQGIPYGKYPVDLIELLDNNPETKSFVLTFPFREETTADIGSYDRSTVPLFLQWDPMWGYETYGSSFLAVTGCGPTCLAMAGYYLTGDTNMTPGQIAAFSQKNGYYASGYGSSWTLISQGAQQLGLHAQELPLVKKKMVTALEEGKPIILALGEGDFTSAGHYIVLTGVEGDAFRVNDPNSRIRSGKLWTYEELEPQIRNIWAISNP